MSGENSPAQVDLWRRLAMLPSRLLPVTGLTDALARGAGAWIEFSRAETVIVFATSGDDEWPGHVVCADGRQFATAVRAMPLDPWPEQGALREVLSAVTGQSNERVAAFPLRFDRGTSGGVVCTYASDAAAHPDDDAVRDALIAIVGRLIEQGQLADAAATAGGLEALKLEAMAELAAGAGHEINNPLATISGRVQLLLKDERDPERRAALLSIGGQAHRIRDMIGDLMLFGRPPEPVPTQLDAVEVVRLVVDSWQSRAATAGGSIVLEAEGPVPAWADKAQLAVAVGALIQNSVEATAGRGKVRVTVTASTLRGLAVAAITVSDDGPGIPPEVRAHLFDPFYSGRQAGRGLGFGLSKCWRIVSNHRGRIDVTSRAQVGTEFRIEWPAGPPDDR